MLTNERHGVYLASVLSTVSLMAVVVLLPLAHQHFQRTMSVMLSNARQCQHQSAKMWHHLVSSPTAQMSGTALRRPTRHSNIDGEKTNNKHADGVQHFKAACCACAQGPPGLRGPPGRDGINGRDEKPGTLGYPGRPGKLIPAPPVEQTSCQMCHPGPPGPPGLPGPKGPRGLAGHAGKAGKLGENNHPGPQGPQGTRGEPGLPGFNGPRGDKGRMLNGAAPGRLGQMGPYGPRGVPGGPGKDGQAGTKGVQGMRGPAGERGDDGPLGAQGPSGMPGTPGEPAGCDHCQKGGGSSHSVQQTAATASSSGGATPGAQHYPASVPSTAAPPSIAPPLTAVQSGSTFAPLTVQQQQQQQHQHGQGVQAPVLGQQSPEAAGQAQPYKAHAVPTQYGAYNAAKTAQFGQTGASAPAIPLPMEPPGQEPATVMPTVISDKFVGYGTVGGYGSAVMAAPQNNEYVEYADGQGDQTGPKAVASKTP